MQIKEKWINDFTSLGKPVETDKGQIRPETRTSIAIGKVSSVDEAGKNNLKVIVKVAGAKYDFAGFLNDNTPVAEILKKAKEEDIALPVRFEKKRKKNIDPATSIDELLVNASVAKDSIVNVVAGVYSFNTQEWILTDDAVSNPAEDPDFVMTSLSSASYNTQDFFNSAPKYVPKLTTDGDWKANHLISMYNFAAEHSVENDIGLEVNALRALATYMLKACDQLQMKIYEIEAPNYNDYSHTKSRAILFSWMKLNPLSRDIMSKKGGFNEWITKFIDEGSELWEWAKGEI